MLRAAASRRRARASARPARTRASRGGCAARAARAGAAPRRRAVGPSTPQLRLQLSSVPSRLSSPLASLCLCVVAHQVAQREAVVAGDEVDAGVRRRGRWARRGRSSPRGATRARRRGPRRRARSGAPRRGSGRSTPTSRRESAPSPVAARAEVPGLGDQLHRATARDPGARSRRTRRCGCRRPGVAAERGREVEAEAVDVHLRAPSSAGCRAPAAARAGGGRFERVAAAGDSRRTRPRVGGVEAVVDGVVDAAQRAASGRADRPRRCGCRRRRGGPRCPARCSALHHRLELGDLRAAAGRREARVGREEAERVVAPVVGEPARDEMRVDDRAVVDRQQLDSGHAERAQVLDDRVGARARDSVPRDASGTSGMAHRHALHVALVDHACGSRACAAAGRRPSRSADRSTMLARRGRRAVERARHGSSGRPDRGRTARRPKRTSPRERARVRVDQQLARVEAMAALRRVGPVHAIAVAAGRGARPATQPCKTSSLRSGRATRADSARRFESVEEAELDRSACADEARSSCPRRPRCAPSGVGVPAQHAHGRSNPRARLARDLLERRLPERGRARPRDVEPQQLAAPTRSAPRARISFAARSAAATRLSGVSGANRMPVSPSRIVSPSPPDAVRDRQRAVALRGELHEAARLEARRHEHAVGARVEPARDAPRPSRRSRFTRPGKRTVGGAQRVGERGLAVADQRDRRARATSPASASTSTSQPFCAASRPIATR